jgi:hypothetical protein
VLTVNHALLIVDVHLVVLGIAAVLLLVGCASVCTVELNVPPHMDCKTIGER